MTGVIMVDLKSFRELKNAESGSKLKAGFFADAGIGSHEFQPTGEDGK